MIYICLIDVYYDGRGNDYSRFSGVLAEDSSGRKFVLSAQHQRRGKVLSFSTRKVARATLNKFRKWLLEWPYFGLESNDIWTRVIGIDALPD